MLYLCGMTCRTIFLIFLCLSTSTASSQILNGGFEDWSGGVADYWHGVGGKDNAAFADSFCYHLTAGPRTVAVLDNKVRQIGPHAFGGSRIPKGRYNITCWYKATLTSNFGQVACDVFTSHEGSISSYNETVLPTTSNWIKIQLGEEITSLDSLNKDSVALVFFLGVISSGAYLTFDIDNVQLEPVQNSVNDEEDIRQLSAVVLPNPLTSHGKIHYSLPQRSLIKIRFFDINGREVLPAINFFSSLAEDTIPFDTDILPNGLYYLRFEADGEVVLSKFIIAH
jgi:hypothetical protein